MNPLRIAEQLRTDYLQLLTTTFAPRQERLKRDFRTAVEREGFLTREPFVSLALPYQGAPTLKAILVYPMNALANDQRDRIRKMLAGTSVSFGVYTGETRQWGQRPEGIPENERLMRSEFRAHPPDILLTNYRMLEYLLLRGDGRALFRNHAVRFIVLDEVHTYKGALGTDVACLMRRLRAALGDASPLFIGTSATLQSGDGDPRTGVAEFFARLTGQPTPPESVIRERTAAPALPEGLTLASPPDISVE